MKPWLCLCYGNGIYTPEADNKYGAIGRPPIATEEVHIVDLMDGAVYDIDAAVCSSEDGKTVFTHIPIRDYPILPVFGNIDSMMEKK